MILFFTLPETARALVGDGSIRPPWPSMLPLPHLMIKTWSADEAPKRKFYFPNPFRCLMLLRRKDRALLVFTVGFVYVTDQCFAMTFGTIFVEKYDFNAVEAGLIFLTMGGGFIVGGIIASRIADKEYRIVAKKYSIEVDKTLTEKLESFPIEEARVRAIPWAILGIASTFTAMGWTIDKQVVRRQLFFIRIADSSSTFPYL